VGRGLRPGLDPAGGGASRCTCWPRRLPHGPCSRPQSVRLSAPVVLRAPGQPACWALEDCPPKNRRSGGWSSSTSTFLSFADPHARSAPTGGASWLMSLNLCQRFARGEWKELFEEAVAERRPGARALPPRAFHRATQNAAAARREACIEAAEEGHPSKALRHLKPTPLARCRRRHPRCPPTAAPPPAAPPCLDRGLLPAPIPTHSRADGSGTQGCHPHGT